MPFLNGNNYTLHTLLFGTCSGPENAVATYQAIDNPAYMAAVGIAFGIANIRVLTEAADNTGCFRCIELVIRPLNIGVFQPFFLVG